MSPTFAIPPNLASPGLGDILPFTPAVNCDRRRRRKDQLLRTLLQAYDGLLQRVISKRTAHEFKQTRDEVIQEYSKIVLTLASAIQLVLPPAVTNAKNSEAIACLENDLKNEGRERFGEVARDQALFTVWTFRRIDRLVSDIRAAGEPPPQQRRQDRELASEFVAHSIWGQFHLDCLIAAMLFDRPLQPEVLSEICEGMRAIVNAYGTLRRGHELRVHRQAELLAASEVEQTAEECDLLAESMSDIPHEVFE